MGWGNIGAGISAAFPVSAIANVGMAAGSGMLNYASQQQANRDNITLAKETMDWQKMMSNTAHQREVQDLKDAGLNPILSAGGSGASTPSGATPTMVAPQIDMPGIFAMVKGAADIDQNQQRIDNETAATKQSIALQKAQEGDTGAAKTLKEAEIKLKDRGGSASFIDKKVKSILQWLDRQKLNSGPSNSKYQKFKKQVDDRINDSNFERLP